MEDSCPATPLILTGRDSKSPLQVALSSPESDGMKSPSPGSPDSRCVICLGRLQNKSFTDSCLHQFCFQCLLQWSKIKAECPLCKQPFKSIIHNVRSNLDYDQYHVEHGEPRYVLSDLVHSYNFDLIPLGGRFRYRSTMTSDYFRELAESFFAHTRRLPEDSYQINPLVPVDPAPAPSVRRSNRVHANASQHRTRQRGTSDFRRNIYAQDLWVQNLADISGRYRECSPQFYRENPAQIHRIIPWLNREVNVLLSDCESHAAYVLSRIISLLTQHPIRSREFREQVQSYFGERTEHFIHELYTFARSVYDIAGFDQNAVYGTNPNYATEVQEISSSSENDSDIEVLETVKSEKRSKKSRQGLKKLLLKRATGGDSKSDEPVAGPSGVTAPRVSDSIEICDSDADEVKVLHYVKPEPEVVTLSSGEEAPAYSDADVSNGDYAEVIDSANNKFKRSSSPEAERRRSKSRGGKGKCRSNGFGLKGKQKRKYIKSRRHRSSSTSSISSRSSTTSNNSIKSSSSSSSNNCSDASYDSRKCKSESSWSSRSSHKSSGKSKKRKSKNSRKKFRKKSGHKSSHKRHRASSGGEKKRKRVKSCVIVPSRSCDSSPTPHRQQQQQSWREKDESKRLITYWSRVVNERSRERTRQSDDRAKQSGDRLRQSDERSRQSDERSRQSDERSRQSDERSRQSDERSRQSDERSRQSDERSRQSDERSRQSDERSRQSDERSRQSDERSRQSDERSRQSDERSRQSDESSRQSDERSRQSDERSRQSDESSRQPDERSRQSDEQSRQSDERSRQSDDSQSKRRRRDISSESPPNKRNKVSSSSSIYSSSLSMSSDSSRRSESSSSCDTYSPGSGDLPSSSGVPSSPSRSMTNVVTVSSQSVTPD